MNPQPFGYYTLINRINIGGMAEVFKACYYQENGHPAFAAIKRILPNLAQDPTFVSMFISEAQTAQKLQHPHIAQIIELGEESNEYYISMEYISGRDLLFLRHHLKERGTFFSPGLSAYVIASIAEALDYAHAMCDEYGRHLEIIHRDVSPQNILISYEGDVKLIDFGIAKAKNRSYENTKAGVLKGKFGYMAPEQIRGQKITHQIDIFALGIVLYELLTNQRLFMGDSDLETLELVRVAKITPPNTINEWIPPALNQITMRALSPDPRTRYQTAGEFAQDLRTFIAHESPMSNQTALRQWMYQEFATYIAHENAQNNHFIEQLRQFAEDEESEDSATISIPQELFDQLQVHQDLDETSDTISPAAHPIVEEEDDDEIATRKISVGELQFLQQKIQHTENKSLHQNYTPQTSTPVHTYLDPSNEFLTDLDDDELAELMDIDLEDIEDLEFSSIDEIPPHQSQASSKFHEQHTPVSQSVAPVNTNQPQPKEQFYSAQLDSQAQAQVHMQAQAQAQLQMNIPSFTPTPHPSPSHRSHSSPISRRPTSPAKATIPLEARAQVDSPAEFFQKEVTSELDIRTNYRNNSNRSATKKLMLILLIILIIASSVSYYFFMMTPSTYKLQIRTQPSDMISIDLDQITLVQNMTTPQYLDAKISQTITIRKPGYITQSILLDEMNIHKPINVLLKASMPSISINIGSNRVGAEVWINGNLMGKTNFKTTYQPLSTDLIMVDVKQIGYPKITKKLSPQKRKHNIWVTF